MEQITNYFLQQGLLGVVIIMLVGVIIYQQRRIDKKEQDARDILDLRLKDSKDYTLSYNGTVERYATLAEKTTTNDELIIQSINGIAQNLQNKRK